MESVEVGIPGGSVVGGRRDRRAWLRPLRGEDEEFLLEEGGAMLPAQRVTALLARCLTRLGDEEPVASDSVLRLTQGDREALVLHLRKLSLGPAFAFILRCPISGCGELVEVELAVDDLLVEPNASDESEFTVEVPLGGGSRTLRFNLPTGADLEAAARVAVRDEDAGIRVLYRRCLASPADDELGDSDLDSMDPVSEAMARLDPQACIVLSAKCGACGGSFEVPFDAADYLYREIWQQRDTLFWDVHTMALRYHWSEADILALPRHRRLRYLDLLAQEPVAAKAHMP
jgi:hypothetical protein